MESGTREFVRSLNQGAGYGVVGKPSRMYAETSTDGLVGLG